MKKIKNSLRFTHALIVLLAISLQSCLKKPDLQTEQNSQQQINQVIDHWHEAAAQADFEKYFDLMSDDAVFIGTDATERWDKKAFQAYAKPHFEKGKAWTFVTLERNIMTDSLSQIAWFDELLDTSFKICRGSGVLKKIGEEWKIQHYVLSMTVPNEQSKSVVQIKTQIENDVILKLKTKE